MISPIELAKALTPWWMMEIRSFDGLEVHPVRDYNRDKASTDSMPVDHETRCDPCPPHEAEFWSVYGHCREGGILCIEDFDSEKQALDFARHLLDVYPHLRERGICT